MQSVGLTPCKMNSTDPKSRRVGVVARVRPFIDGESTERCIDVEESAIVLHQHDCPAEDQQFTFDRCYGDTASQDALFEAEVSPIVNSTVAGFNGTVFCYGVTGSGKTYTMGIPQANVWVWLS